MLTRRGVRSLGLAACAAAAAVALTSVAACRRARATAEQRPITPSCQRSSTELPAGTPMMVTYTWTVDRSSPPLAPELRAFVHFVGPDGGIVFTDDHTPDPPVGSWKPGQS